MEAAGEVTMDNMYFMVPQKAAIEKDGKFLIMKRAPDNPVYPNCWDLPGGRLEQGEDPTEGLKREVREETNLEIEVFKPEFIFAEKLDHYNLFIIYKCNMLSKDLKLSKEHTEFKWATKEEILKLETENFLRAYLEGRK